MKRTIFVWTTAMLTVAAPTLAAQHGRGGSPKPPAHTQPAHAPKPAPAPHAQGASSIHAGQGGSKVHGGGATKPHAKPPSPSGHGHADAHATSTTSTKAHGKTAVAQTGTLSPAQQKLQQNTKLAGKLQGRLPAGTDLMAAASGFRNLGQFVAAVNVSNNLGIPFSELKARMIDQGMSLGQAIHDLRPSTDTQTIVQRAERDADLEIRSSDSTVQSKTKTKVKTKTTSGRKHGEG